MKYIKKDLGSYNLHLINTNKYKTVTMKIVFHSPIKKEDITKRNVLSDILLQSCKKYQSKRDMIIESENLYALDIYNNIQRYGNYSMFSFTLQVLNDRYTEDDNLEKSIEFLSEILCNPDISNNAFKKDKLSIVKNNTEVVLSSLKEDPVGYSQMRLYEAFDKEGPISYRMVGYKEDLSKITKEDLYTYYKNMIENDYVDIFIAGDFDNVKIVSIIKKYFKFRKIKKRKINYELDIRKCRKRRLFAKEKCEASQSKLAIACPISKMSTYEKNYPLVLANILFGGSADSKLFKNVREKNSLCYTINSSVSKLDNLMTIKAGIDKDNFNKTVEVITKTLDDMKKGKFTDKDINIAKELYKSYIMSIEEDPMRIINEYLSMEIIDMDSYNERIEIMDKVKKRDIIKVFKKINMDTIFLLEGDIK